jgi:hypothetical protein
MAALERFRAAVAVGCLCAVAALAACASAGDSSAPPSTLPPQTVVAPPSAGDAAAPEAPAVEPQAVPASGTAAPSRARKGSSTLIVIDPATPDAAAAPTSLAAAAAQERERRQREGTPAVVINNKNLAGYAAGGVLTIAQDDPSKAGDAASAAAEDEPESSASENYWRQRGLEMRKKWRDAVDRIPVLQAKAEELRQRFYSTDDPALRDGQIKPDWDRALADLEQARYQASRGADEVASFLEEGRRAGALPGWLREGAELEPEPVLETVDGSQPANEPQEPEVYSEPPLEPPPASSRR